MDCRLGIAPHKALKGINSVSDADNAAALLVLPVDEALNTSFDTDAHFICYQVPDEDVWPRINKVALSDIYRHGASVTSTLFAVDIDTENHADITEEWLESLAAKIDALEGPIGDWYAFYTTAHGARLIYVYDEISVEDVEDYVGGILHELYSQGIECDYAAADWTRLFRMPKVFRDGKRTEDHPLFVMDISGRILNLNMISPKELSVKTSPVEFEEGDYGTCPSVDKAKALIEVFQGGRLIPTEWAKWARKRLRGRECYDSLFNGVPLAQPGSRDDTLLNYVGSVISMTYDKMGTTPAHVFGLFIDAVMDFDQDEAWDRNLWSKICRMWDCEKHATNVERSLASTDTKGDLTNEDRVELMAKGMNTWCEHELLDEKAGTKEKEFFLQRHALASMGDHYYLLREDGFYEAMPLRQTTLIPRIEITGMTRLVPVYTESENGNVKRRSVLNILSAHSTPISEIRMVPQIPGGYIHRMNSSHPILYLPAYRRNEQLRPEFNEDVATWLSLLAGEHLDDLLRWIALSLDFEGGPICALSLCGSPGAGKKMFVEGLSECLEVPTVASADDLVGDYQSNLLKTPFLNVNEGWPRQKKEDISTRFRAFVSGDTIQVNEKFKPLINVQNPLRLILTANNTDMVQGLTDGKDLSPYDRQAISDRLYHLDVGREAADWLRAEGGRKLTAKDGQRWIRGDGGQRSDFVVARHFLFLHSQKHRFKRGQRFLVDGNVKANSRLMHNMLTGSGSAPLVIETILSLVEQAGKGNTVPGLVTRPGDQAVYILPKAILERFRTTLSQKTKEKLSLMQIERVLKNLIISRPELQTLEEQPEQGHCEWHRVDPYVLLKTAQRVGHQHQALSRLIEGTTE